MTDVSYYCQADHFVMEFFGRGGAPNTTAVLFAGMSGDVCRLRAGAARVKAKDRRPECHEVLTLVGFATSGSDNSGTFAVTGVGRAKKARLGNRGRLCEGASSLPPL